MYGPIEIDVIAETYLGQRGEVAEDVGLRPEATAAYGAVKRLEVGGDLSDGSIFLMPPQIPEVSDIPGEKLSPFWRVAWRLLVDTPPPRGGSSVRPRVVAVVRVGVKVAAVEKPIEAAQ